MIKSKENWNLFILEEEWVIVYKGIECFFIGEYDNYKVFGVYVCCCCEVLFYKLEDKFFFGCGWLSFDDEILGVVRWEMDVDGWWIEIFCDNCGGYFGYVFIGEWFMLKNICYCVNFIFMKFIL